MNNVSFVLYSYKKIHLKTQNKDILILSCVFNNEYMYPIFMSYSEINEEFCKNYLKQDITQYVSLRISNDKGLIAYIKI